MEPGVHLRWGFKPDLGFPRNGFTIDRSLLAESEFPIWSEWRTIAEVTLPIYDAGYYPAPGRRFPNEVAEAKRRITDRLGGRYTPLSDTDFADLIAILHNLMDDGGPPAHTRLVADDRASLSLRTLDLLHLAGTDPYMARVLGVYWVDTGGIGNGGDSAAADDVVIPSHPVAYRIIGDWGRDPWPEQVVTFEDIDTREFAAGRITVGELTILTPRELTLLDEEPSTGDDSDGELPRLRITGVGSLPTRFVLPYPVQELRLKVEEESAPDDWVLTVEDGDGSRINVTTTANTDGIRIRAQDSDKMVRVDLFQSSDEVSEVTLVKVGYRENLGNIGTQESVAILDRSADRVDYPPHVEGDVIEFHGSEPVPTPQLVCAEGGNVPPTLDTRGRVPDSTGNVTLESFVADAERDSYRPVRLHVRRQSESASRLDRPVPPSRSPGRDFPELELDRGTPVLDRGAPIGPAHDRGISPGLHWRHRVASVLLPPEQRLLTMPDPVVHPRSDLLASWTFNEDLTDTVSGRTAELIDGDGAPSQYMGFGRNALLLRGGRYLEMTAPASLSSLGETLTIQTWIRPLSTDGFRTIVGNNYRRSFWIGLRRDTNQLRFWLRGSSNQGPLHSSESVPVERWSHVAVTYDGKRVRFYLDGKLDSSHVLPSDSIQLDPHDTIRIGADWNASGEADYFMDGGLANLQIFRDRRPLPDATTDGLVAALPFDDDTRERVTGAMGTQVGTVEGFEPGHPDNITRSFLTLSGDGFVELDDHPGIDGRSSKLTVEAWVRPDTGQESGTIVGNGEEESFWFGLDPGTTGYVLRFTLSFAAENRTVSFVSDDTLDADRWTHVAVSYDGEAVRFYLDGVVDAVHEARYGPIKRDADTVLSIGADVGSTADALRAPLSGGLADVRVWSAVPELQPAQYHHDELAGNWPLDGNLENVHTGNSGTLRGRGEFVTGSRDDDERKVLSLRGDGFVEVADRPALQPISSSMAAMATIRPTGNGIQTIVGNDWRRSFWLGVVPSAGDYYLRAWLNGNPFQSSHALPADRWSDVALTYDGEMVTLVVNGSVTARSGALGPIEMNPSGTLCIGADAGSSTEGIRFPFVGKLADVQLWRRTVMPDEVTDATDSTASFQYEDREVQAGRYQYGVQGIDLFGRTSEWSSKQVRVVDRLPPPAPTGVDADYLPLTGHVTESAQILTGEDGDTRWRFTTDIPVPDTLIVDADSTVPALAKYDICLARSHGDQTRTQSAEITSVERNDEGRMVLETDRPVLARFRPDIGDEATIEFDHHVALSWTWTGHQRLYWPRAREFRVYHEPGPLNTLVGTVSALENRGEGRFRVTVTLANAIAFDIDELADGWCQIGSHSYRVTGNTVGPGLEQIDFETEYIARPVIDPEPGAEFRMQLPSDSEAAQEYERPESWTRRHLVESVIDDDPLLFDQLETDALSEEAFQRLQAEGIPGFQSSDVGIGGTAYHRVHRVQLPDVEAPSESAQEYVQGALVGFVDDGTVQGWMVFDVVWREPLEGDGAALYLRISDTDVDSSTSLTLRRVRYYPGQRYRVEFELPVAFASGTVRDPVDSPASGAPTAEGAVAVSTADDVRASADSRNEPERFGNESAVSRPASLVAVDRRRPPEPPRPEVVIGRADYYGDAPAAVSWRRVGTAEEGIRYNLYRAVDSAVFTRDLEQRRLGTGPYAYLDGFERFGIAPSDVDDVRTWFEVQFPDEVTTVGGETLPDPSLFVEPTNEAGWKRTTSVWRAWSEWFYPALDDEEVRTLAELQGNDEAFALVTESPVSETSYTDTVPGGVDNRYIYRIESVSPALSRSRAFGMASAPVASKRTRPPRAPRFTAIDPGDRRVTLRWALDSDPEVEEYRLYRTEIPSEGSDEDVQEAERLLDDLRHWTVDYRDNERWVATVPDPYLRTERRSVSLPGAPTPESIEGVYRVDEVDLPSLDNLSDVLNYYDPEASVYDLGSDPPTVRSLRRIPDGTPVVVVVGRHDGTRRAIDRVSSTVEFRATDGSIQSYQTETDSRRPLTVERRTIHLPMDLSPDGILGVFAADDFDQMRDPPENQPDAPNFYAESGHLESVAGQAVIRGLSAVDEGTPVVVVLRVGSESRVLTHRHAPLEGLYADESLLGLSEYAYRLVTMTKKGVSSEASPVMRARTLELTPPEVPTITVERIGAGTVDVVTIVSNVNRKLELMIQKRTIGESAWRTVQPWTDANAAATWSDEIPETATVEYRVWCRTPGGRVCERPEATLVEPRGGSP